VTIQKQNRVLVALVTAVFFGACSDDFASISTASRLRELFEATLTGAAERPTPVTTTASGASTITILDTNLIRVETRVSTIDSVTQAHIHAGDANTAGPIMVFLLANVSAGRAPITGTNRVLSQLDITRTTTFLTGWNFDSLMTRIKNGTAYVNVHTRRNPNGEIRGQITPTP
jgi:hypothetical protein